uniref:Secreted protein n=1 Tax=Echeneis naucrates TaxID=173247 RepID=A0A665TR08_ECHNA
MEIFNHLLLVSYLLPLVVTYPSIYPFYPPTCYTKVLIMARELTQWNGCVMYKMRAYISLVEGLRQRRCAYTREVRKVGVTLRQLFIIMSEKCHGVR